MGLGVMGPYTINHVNIIIHYHHLLNYAPLLQTTFISKFNNGETNNGIWVTTYTAVNNLHSKNELVQDHNFNYHSIYFKIDKHSSKLFAKQREILYISTYETIQQNPTVI